MMKIRFYIFLFFMAFSSGISAQVNDTVMIDFGDGVNASAIPWNNLTNAANGTLADLITSANIPTAIGVAVINDFVSMNFGGTTSPDPLIGFPATATKDSYYGQDGANAADTGIIEFSGLNTSKYYKFVIFASRTGVSDNREAQYMIEGATSETIFLNASNNTSNVVHSGNLLPDAEGKMRIGVTWGPNNNNSSKYFYLGALKLIYEQDPVPIISIITPNGGNQISVGSIYDITWSGSNLTSDVVVSFSSDNGANWSDIATVDESISSYAWTVPAIYSDACLIRVSSGIATDQSNSTFSIIPVMNTVLIDLGDVGYQSPAPWNNLYDHMAGSIMYLLNEDTLHTPYSITVTNDFVQNNRAGTTVPNPDLNFPPNATYDSFYGQTGNDTGTLVVSNLNTAKYYTFTFFASRAGVSDNREAMYISRGATSDTVYLNASNNTGNVVTTEALMPDANGNIEIDVTWGPGNNNSSKFYYLGVVKMMYDEEPALPASLSLASPNGGEAWLVGSEQTISFNVVNLSDSITVEYSTDAGNYWFEIATVDKTTTSLIWTIPDAVSSQCLVRVSSGTLTDVSDSNFSIIVPQLHLIFPNGGEDLTIGSAYDISWTSEFLSQDIVISFSTDNGTSWSQIASVPFTDNSYSWMVPNTPSDQCLVKVTSESYMDASDAVFSISEPIYPVLDLLLPNGGETYYSGSTQTISWISLDLSESIEINFTADGGSSWSQLAVVDPDVTTYEWLIPELSSNQCLISLISGSLSDSSDNYFSIAMSNDTVLIDLGDVNFQSPSPWNNLIDHVSGSISHLINTNELATNMGIAITNDFVQNNRAGTITPDPDLGFPANATYDSFYGQTGNDTGTVVISGLNPEKYYTLTYFASRDGVSDNRETMYITQGAEISTLYLNPSGNSANVVTTPAMQPDENGNIEIDVTWGPANNNSNKFYYLGIIQIVYSHEAPVDPYITVVTPNGGEIWQQGFYKTLEWDAVNLTEAIQIQYSTDSGNTWSEIEEVAPDQRQYIWNVPNTISDHCLVSLQSGSYADVSDGEFSIIEQQESCTLVVLGSSTAAGVGPSTMDSAWVNRYRTALQEQYSGFEVVNLALGGYTTYQILPTGFEIPSGVNESIDVNRNITKALEYEPFAIIINMPSNDAVKLYTVEQQLTNYDTIYNYAAASGVQVWIATTQPRNFTNPVQIQIQFDLADTIPDVYGNYAIDFWNDLADENGFIKDEFDSGDGIHLNDAGHRLLFSRVWDKHIDTTSCFPTATASIDASGDAFKLFPNPFNHELNLEIASVKAYDVWMSLSDITGSVVAYSEMETVNGINTYNLSAFASKAKPGVYLLNLRLSNENDVKFKTFKVIKTY